MSDTLPATLPNLQENYQEQFGFHMPKKALFETEKGLHQGIVQHISQSKNEADWMLAFRLKALQIYEKLKMPSWGPDLSQIPFDNLNYYVRSTKQAEKRWEDVPNEVKQTFDRLGIPEAERAYLAGVEAQYDSEVAYSSLRAELEDEGVIFLSTDAALQKYPELFREYFSTVVSPADNKFAALNSAVWSGGSFVYIPKNVKVKKPLQAYFRINAATMGQFERTLIIADEGSEAQYVEGCTAPIYSADSLHAAVVEVIVKKGARFRYTTIQNWSNNVYNLVTKRAHVYEDGVMEWIDGNLGAKVTMKYPSCYLLGKNAYGEMLSIAYAAAGQEQDAGAKMLHLASNTSSKIISKSVSHSGGITSYRGLVSIKDDAKDCKAKVECDALILDEHSKSNTYPKMDIRNADARVEHEATVSKIEEEKLFYLMSRGLSETEAMTLIVAGFIEPIVKELPMEYAVELNRLIELEMEGSVG
jgi:Fe-S cluster assembly protein SufB